MSKPRIPSYRRQKQKKRNDQAFVEIDGQRHYLGRHGSPESKARYQRLIADWLSNGGDLPPEPDEITVVELIARWWQHAEKHYRDRHGNATTSQRNARYALRWIKDMFGDLPVADFGPRCLKAVQASMMRGKLSRPYINKQVSTIKQVFKWGVAEELVEPSVYHALQAVPGLQAGRTEARETEPVKQVAEHHVDAILPHLSRPVRAMVELQRATGMRPDEVVSITPAEIDMSAEVWTYQPIDHKTAYRQHARIIFIGPKGQAILKAWLRPDRAVDKPIFRPADAVAEMYAKRHEQRTTPLSCGNRPGTNLSEDPKRPPGDQYEVAAYRRAIHRACDRAYPPPKDATGAKLDAWRAEHRWSPNRLRHSYATMVRRDHGLEAAQVLLGHTKADITQVYAERDSAKAREVARQVG